MKKTNKSFFAGLILALIGISLQYFVSKYWGDILRNVGADVMLFSLLFDWIKEPKSENPQPKSKNTALKDRCLEQAIGFVKNNTHFHFSTIEVINIAKAFEKYFLDDSNRYDGKAEGWMEQDELGTGATTQDRGERDISEQHR